MKKEHRPWALLAIACLVPVYALAFRSDPPNRICEALPEAIAAAAAIWDEGTSAAEDHSLFSTAMEVNDLHWSHGCTPCAQWEVTETIFEEYFLDDDTTDARLHRDLLEKYGLQAAAACS